MNELTYEEACSIYAAMQSGLDQSDADHIQLFGDMIERACRYASIRAEWLSLSREQRRKQDESRTIAHDAFISSVGIVARLEGETGSKWRSSLGDDRKRIGDLACYIACFRALAAR